MIRGYEEQFDDEKVQIIRKLIENVNSLSFPAGVSRYYAVNLAICLEAGALLGALQVAASLLELYVREVVIDFASQAYSGGSKQGRILIINY